MTKYVLDDDGNPKQISDNFLWAKWVETHRQPLAADRIGEVTVKTVFLALDVRCPPGVGVPLVYETFVVGGKYADESTLYSTKEAAMIGHEAILNAVRRSEVIQ